MTRCELSQHIALLVGAASLPLLCVVQSGCTSDDGPPDDPRLWTHEQLMSGAALFEPDDTNGIRVAVLSGSPYQMGYQHGALLAEEIDALRTEAEEDIVWSTFIFLAGDMGPDDSSTYIELAMENSLDSVVEECEGIVDGSAHAMEMEHCILLASITYVIEDLIPRHFPGIDDLLGCSGFVAVDEATADSRMIHARNLDYLALDAIMDNPMVFVRRPTELLRHVNLGWPGLAAIMTGMNERGLTGEINENSCPSESFRDMTGVPATQQLANILARASTIEEAEAIVAETEQASCQLFLFSHAPSRRAAVLEIWAHDYRTRDLDDAATGDVLFATNHFEHPEASAAQDDRDILDLTDNSVSRFYRLAERLLGSSLPPHAGLDADAPDFVYGRLDVETSIDVLRDPVDLRPDQDRMMFPCTEHEDGKWAIGNNHNIHSVIMLGESLELWMSAGWDEECINPLYNPYVGFDLTTLFEGEYVPGLLPSFDPPFNDTYGTTLHED